MLLKQLISVRDRVPGTRFWAGVLTIHEGYINEITTFIYKLVYVYTVGNETYGGTPKMESKTTIDWGEPISTYTQNQAVEDGILMPNPWQDRFAECNIITCHLFEKIEEIATKRNKSKIFPVEPLELIGCLMVGAQEIYTKKDFKGDNDQDFFVMPKTDEGIVVWFVRNETGKLTAMLPEDY